MQPLATIDLFASPQPNVPATTFRGRDRYSLSDKRRCLHLAAPAQASFTFQLTTADLRPGTAELCMAAMPEVLDSHAYARKNLNSVLAITLNGETIFDGVLHWRSHEETAAYWPWFNFTFAAALLRPGANQIVIHNRTTRETLGEYFDAQLIAELGEAEAVRKLATIYLSDLTLVHVADPERFPKLVAVPATAVAGEPFVVEVNTGPQPAPISVESAAGARVAPLGAAQEYGESRSLFEVTPQAPGTPIAVVFRVAHVELPLNVATVYAAGPTQDLFVLPGFETTYWHMVKPAVREAFERCTGTGVRISIDDFLANLHFIPLEKWQELVRYLVRRRRHLALQRLRVPTYTRIQQAEMIKLADMAGPLFAGVAVPEPINHMTHSEPDLAKRVGGYLDYFKQQMQAIRLPGHTLQTFDAAGPMCGHYYRLGLDVHVAEIGPACNVLEESCCRGAAIAYGKPWGVAAAMHWYFGQGAQYAYDEARVRLARLTMFSAYLAGARQILWEGGVFDNLPVYNYILSEESWRDYYRRYDDPHLQAMRANFTDLVDYHRAQQFTSPKVRYGVVRGINDVFRGNFDASASRVGDMSIARSWSMLSVFLPHVSFGRWGHDHSRPARRWYSATPYGQVDVIPAEADGAHFNRYQLLALLGWNTMDEDLHAKLLAYVEQGGRLFISLPHLVTDTMQKLEWTFFRGGDLSALCGVKVADLGGRIERVKFHTPQFEAHLPAEFALTPRNPLFPSDFDEAYDVFAMDATFFGGELSVGDAEVLATSQRGESVLLRHRVGKGEVYLLNTWCHPGRGQMQALAEGILRGLVESCPAPLRVDDPSRLVAWFEYPAETYTRYVFLNTDWTQGSRNVPVRVTLGKESFSFEAPPARPVQVVSDGEIHVLMESMAVQIVDWRKNGGKYEVVAVGGESGELPRLMGKGDVTWNGKRLT